MNAHFINISTPSTRSTAVNQETAKSEVHTSAGKNSANANPEASFASALVQVLDGDQLAVEVEDVLTSLVPTDLNLAVMLGLKQRIDEAAVEPIAAKILEVLEQRPMEVEEAAGESVLLQQWLSQAAAWIMNQQNNGNGKVNSAENSLSEITEQKGTAITSKQIQASLELFMSALNESTRYAELQKLSRSLQAAFEPILALANVEPANTNPAVAQNTAASFSNGVMAVPQAEFRTRHLGTEQAKNAEVRNAAQGQASASASNKHDVTHNRVNLLARSAGLDWLSLKYGHSAAGQMMNGGEPTAAVEQASPEADSMPALALPPQDLSKLMPTEAIKLARSTQIHSQHFTQEMSQYMLKNIRITEMNGFSEAKITLFPEHLGKVDVLITMNNGQLTAHFMADTLAGKDLLENQLHQLRAVLQNQGLQVDKLEVTQNSNVQSNLFHDHRQQQSSQQPFESNKRKAANYEDATIVFATEMNAVALTKGLGYGSSFDASA